MEIPKKNKTNENVITKQDILTTTSVYLSSTTRATGSYKVWQLNRIFRHKIRLDRSHDCKSTSLRKEGVLISAATGGTLIVPAKKCLLGLMVSLTGESVTTSQPQKYVRHFTKKQISILFISEFTSGSVRFLNFFRNSRMDITLSMKSFSFLAIWSFLLRCVRSWLRVVRMFCDSTK